MNKKDFDKLLQTLPTLKADQCTMLLDRLSVSQKMGLHSTRETAANPVYEEWFHALAEVLRSKGQRLGSFSVFRKLDLYKTYQKQVDHIQPFIDNCILLDNRLSKSKRLGLYIACVETLVEAVDIFPMTPKTLVNHLHLIPSAMESAFPGYAEAGMLSWVVDL